MHTKNFLFGLLGICLLLTAACSQIQLQQDEKLIAKAENDLQRWQSELGQYETIGANIESFQKEVATALPDQPGAPADSLKLMVNKMVERQKAALVTYKESIATLTNRLAEYRAGNATQEALTMEIKAVQSSLGNMGKAFGALQTEQQQAQAILAARK